MSLPIIYVDVDDTFVRSFGHKCMPMPAVIEKIKVLFEKDVTLYCWSSGGAEYARQSAREFGIEHCFVNFLPKPNILLDDVLMTDWPRFLQIHPSSLDAVDVLLLG